MDQVSQIRERTDIVALINSFIPLKKMGNNYKANCPFHGEKTPSFVVSSERQIWHCFGCQKGGDAFSFLMEYEHVEFPEALRVLADKAGIQLIQKGFDSGMSSKKELFYTLNSLSAEFYHFLLTKHEVGKQALTYVLDKRKIKPQTIKTYMLGFSPVGNLLTSYLTQKKQYNIEDVLDAGLATKRYNGTIGDFFQGRLMFPLYDHRNNIIGFSGRVLQDDEKTSKYINTRDTLIYHKGQVFFGLNSSKESIKKENRAIIMEGEFDVIAAFQEGIINTVAIKGTAFTDEQAHLIKRFATTVTMCLDGDNAGQEAFRKSLPILEKQGITTTVIIPPNGKDPDESIKTDPIAFKKAVKHDTPAYELVLTTSLQKHDPTTALGKKQIGDDVLPLLANITNEIVKEHYLRKLSQAIETSYDNLLRQISSLEKKEVVKKEIVFVREQKNREEVAEEFLMALLLQHASPQLFLPMLSAELASYPWKNPVFQKILNHLQTFTEQYTTFSVHAFIDSLPKELVDTFDRCFLFPLDKYLPLSVTKNDDLYMDEVKKRVEELKEFGRRRMKIQASLDA